MSVAAKENKALISPLVVDVAGNNFNHGFEPDLAKIIG